MVISEMQNNGRGQYGKKWISYKGNIEWDSNKPDGTMRKVLDVSKIHLL